MRGERVQDLVPGRQRFDAARDPEVPAHVFGQLTHRDGAVGADVEHFVLRTRLPAGPGDHRRHVRDVTERARLRAVAEHGKRTAFERAPHEDADHVPVRVGDVLTLAVDIVRTEDGVLEAELVPGGGQIKLARIFRHAVRIDRLGRERLGHRRLARAVDGDRTGEHEPPRAVVDRGVDERDGAHQVVRVVEPADEVRQALGRVRGQVIDVAEAVLGEQTRDQFMVDHAPANERHALRKIVLGTTGEIVEHDHGGMAGRKDGTNDMGADEAGAARHQGRCFHVCGHGAAC